MKLTGRIYRGRVLLMEDEYALSGEGKFQKQLEQSLVELCRKMGISVPMWLGKNTREFARYRWTSFQNDQFLEPVNFDRFEIRLEDV
ncbi:hypothetical protein Cst_c02960 [Thermoclostridium stercorarium subsp. stercorarium DSM 8532]|jgi:hypothetical protein|uniref:Uncharacterized protein n=2 Tax=Thermoclostridium stercorarium TaxID=1510 RepID=L7VH42_THES1|nr:hypothetical protein [Thermoclostridium stercorarium]AGC67320.1 hypothetical protein Cst_c02960 [Thermoclostridium stercorarium subsp. stercorarium DSM 8532]AGI38382.1 hypothetical protein Clst_0279 [Thermoclostridium stercorarium subsp. stercorarium DSM 8532]ANW97818.1 hypothetical protein CSTERTH_01590 [Thermoclostridium stercorarium subsp. thermolacticum DSM 2910]UZQ85891.1 hypothetical protein ODU73_000266 [Thermoclostridium stercorarium]